MPGYDVQNEFAQPFALLVIAELLGVPEDGVDIPAGTTIVMSPHAANRDPERFEAPAELHLEVTP